MSAELTKECPVCGVTKSVEDFHWKIRAKGWRQSMCKVCARSEVARWRAANPERVKVNNDRYFAEKRDAILAQKRRRAAEDPDWRVASDRRYHAKNREKRYAAQVEWRKANRARQVAHEHKRRIPMQTLTRDDYDYIAVLRCDSCSYCGEAAGTIDHIQPLSGGGSGGWENLTASCRRCNGTKRTTALLRFLLRS